MKASDFSKEQFLLKILLRIPVAQTFRLLTSEEGLCSWFLGEVKFFRKEYSLNNNTLQAGDQYHFKWQKDFEATGEIISIKENEHFHFTFGQSFKVIFEIKNIDGLSEISLRQTNSDPQTANEFAFINCCICWSFFLTNLKSVAEFNIDLRETQYFNESFINQ